MCSEREREGCEGESGLTPRLPAVAEFKDALFSLVHLCQIGSLASSAAPSPRDGHTYSRSQSIVSEDFSSVPPEEPEWLSKMGAARALNRAFSGRSRPASRRDSGLGIGTGGRLPGSGGTGTAPSPLRGSLNVATGCLQLEEASTTTSGGAPSPCTLDTARQTLFDRFGSFEGLSAALEDFYHRLCSDERVGQTIKQVPEHDIWLILTQLMALLLQQQEQYEEPYSASNTEGRQSWIRRCQELLQPSGAAAGGKDETDHEQGMEAVYDAAMTALRATLERLGALGCGAGSRGGGCTDMAMEASEAAGTAVPGLDDLPRMKPVAMVVSQAPQVR